MTGGLRFRSKVLPAGGVCKYLSGQFDTQAITWRVNSFLW